MAAALDAAGYERCITLTRPPGDAIQAASRFAHSMRREYDTFEWVWTLEVPPDNPEHVHLHSVVRSRYIPQTHIVKVARDAGYQENSWVTAGSGGTGRYMAKYVSKLAAGSYQGWRTLNGGTRPFHWSRMYTQGIPMRVFVPKHAPARDPGPWERIPAAYVPAYAAWRDEVEETRRLRAEAALPAIQARARAICAHHDAVAAARDGLDGEIVPGGEFAAAARDRRIRDGDAMVGWRAAERAASRPPRAKLTSESA
jgi:hypothetical protein